MIFSFLLVPQQGYKSTKARLGMRRVRPWAWVQFCNPARKDGALLWHWRRVADQGKEYPFAQFDKVRYITSMLSRSTSVSST